ncbi:MAG: sugar phosphate isomerase/epimerase family protein [Gemmatimonadaceae bacterium]
MHRREFVTTLGSAVALSQLGCAKVMTTNATGTRQLRRVGIQLYTLRDDARRDLEGTLANIAQMGYKDVELLSSMNNFGMPPATLRKVLDRNGLRAPSTHIGVDGLANITRQLDDAETLGHKYIILASLPEKSTLDDYRRTADSLNEAGRITRERNIWIAFHDEAQDFAAQNGQVPYEVLVNRTDPNLVRLQLDTGNLAVGGRDPMDYMKKYSDRYWLFHIKDAPQIGAKTDTELGKGVIDFRRLLASIDHIDDKFLYVEQETYPGAPLDSARRDFAYLSHLQF